MNKKKWTSLIAMLFILAALMMYLGGGKVQTLHDYFWIPLVLGAVFLFTATKIK